MTSGQKGKRARTRPMRELRVSGPADRDIVSIAEYTTREFGERQARKCRDDFQACFRSLLDNPHLGRSAEELAPGLRRIRQQAHVVFYLPSDDAVLIVRVLHASMDFERRF
ncbi:type II toxin-antitoxin system RelE/ParE family toxin [Aurantiacibacter aquimixticola]|uniref:Toxin n=1 Tax=Aurantiacibacter aquimixticola TaxID=1958945 RepID=A0A419RVD4_9SPHN|nr:type II toxin-antitoxin system RelE/ParE family toxin [Aurantiacibacter aquimixticola]RJY09724.1 type II toxin-antitoxin system RelE/ParE family toxin [Aurantiacibacter aquimixticola]